MLSFKKKFPAIFYRTHAAVLIVLSLSVMPACKQQDQEKQRVVKDSAGSTVIIQGKDTTIHSPLLQLKQGDKYQFAVHNKTGLQVEVNGNKIDNKTDADIVFTYLVVSDTGNQYRVKITYDRFHTIVTSNDEEKEMDGDNGVYSFDPNERLLAYLKGKSFFITIRPNGELVSASGYKEIADSIAAKMQIDDAVVRSEIQKQLSNFLGEGFIKENIAQNAGIFPAIPISADSRWTKNTSETSPVPITGTASYEIEKADDSQIHVTGTTESKSNGQAAANLMGYSVALNVTGKGETDYVVDRKTGIAMSEKVESTLAGSVQIMGREVPVTITLSKEIQSKKL